MTYLEHVFNYTNQEEYEFVVIAPEHYEFELFCKQHSVTYYPIKIQRSINPVKDGSAFFKIISILRMERPDIVHTHSAKGGFIGRLAATFFDVRVVYSPHAFSYLSFKGMKRIIFYSLEYVAKKWTDVLLSVSFSEANRAIYELDYDSYQVKTILNAIPVDENLPFRNYEQCIKIGMIGRLTYQKNPLLFLEVAFEMIKKNPLLEFSILGAGLTDHLACEIEDFITKNKIRQNINILSWGDNDTSRNFLKNQDLFVMTSVFEGLPFSLVEAMALGIPCVVSKVDGNTDVIQNYENGFSCLTKSEFQKKIELLIESEDLRRQIGQAAYRYVKTTHDINQNIKKLEELYTDLHRHKLLNLKNIRINDTVTVNSASSF